MCKPLQGDPDPVLSEVDLILMRKGGRRRRISQAVHGLLNIGGFHVPVGVMVARHYSRGVHV